MHTLLDTITWISLGVAFTCAAGIALDEIRHPQQMWVMNIVWPVTALYLSVFAVWGYLRVGRGMTKKAMAKVMGKEKEKQAQRAGRAPTLIQTAISDSHCGAGCTVGDIIAEFGVFAFGLRF